MKKIIKYLIIINLIFTITSFGQITKVDDFGAVGDGVTNDRDAIQAALDDVRTNGGELQFTSGKTYLLNLTSNDDGQMRCGLNLYYYNKVIKISTTDKEKATIKIASSVPTIWGNWLFRIVESENLTISNIRLDANRDGRTPAEVAGVHTLQIDRRCNGLRLEDLHIINGVADNIYINGYPSDDTTKYTTNLEMHNCVVENAYRNNMSVIRGLNYKIIGCEFNNANGTLPEAGIDFEPNQGGSNLGYRNMLVEGCTFRNNKGFGIWLTNIVEITGYSIIKNNVFDNNGLGIASVKNVVKNNVFINLDHKQYFSDQSLRDGVIYFHVDHKSSYNKVYNNYFYNNPTPSDMHIINFMSNAGIENEVYNNYEFNNNVVGFVNNTDNQIVYGNTILNTIEMGLWNFDLGFISESSVFDLSDFSQTGTMHGNPTTVGGKFNEALDFSPDNKYIDIPINREQLNIEMNLSISAWINWKGTNSESEQVIVGRSDDWQFGLDNSGKLGFYAPQTTDTSYVAGWTKTEAQITTGEWKHVVLTYNGNETKIYIDGVEKASEKGYGSLDTNSAKIFIASLVDDKKSFNGSIDDVRIYNYPLSQDEINDLFNAVNLSDKAKPEGSGTEADPYQIGTVQNLSWLAQSSDEWATHFVQTADIDLSVTATWDDADDNSDGDKYNDFNDRLNFGNNEGWSPIGNLNGTKKFTGSYNGNRFTIEGVSITNRSTDGNGFFGEITSGVVKNLSLTKIDIHGSNIVGGLVASCSGDSIINSYATGKIICVDGGSVGSNFGGLVGVAKSNTVIKQSYSDVEIKGSGANSTKVGGLVGSVNMAQISACYSLGKIETVGASSGGFAGEVSGSSVIEECYSVGLVDNRTSDKGFVGAVGSGTPTFTNNFFDKESSGHSSSVGATAKTTNDMIIESTFTGWDFTTTWETITNYPNLLENSNPRLEKGIDYQPIEAPEGSGTEADPYKIVSLTNLVWLAQVDSVWGDYFVQTSDIDASETATWDDSDDNNDGNKYNDPNDLTNEGTNDGFSPIGNSSTKFLGFYDGSEFTINKLVINRASSKYIGFLGIIEKPHITQSEIKNISLTNINIIGKGKVGGLVGENNGVVITNSYAEGTVSSSSSDGYIGGFIGSNNRVEAIVSKCYSNVHVSSSGSGQYVGGFVGRNRSGAEINKCYSKGSVESGGNKVGGFIGQNAASKVINCFSMASVSSTGSGTNIGGFCGAVYGASIEYCYSVGANNADNTKGFLGAKGGTGNVFTSNYLDTVASGCNQTSIPEAASGKTTSEMLTASTFVGWDFTNVWSIDGNYYPLLTGVKVGVKSNEIDVIPTEYVLEQNYPNPFNPTTVIRFSIPKASDVQLSVYNVLGEKVAELINENLSAGNHEVNFNASTSSAIASNLSSGIYLYRITATSTSAATGSFVAVKKMLLIK